MAVQEPQNQRADQLFSRSLFAILLLVFVIALLWVMRDGLTPILLGGGVLLLVAAIRRNMPFETVVGGLAVILLGVWFFSEVTAVLWPFVCSFILAYLLAPLVNVLHRHMPRSLAIGVIILLILGCLSAIGAVVIPRVIMEVGELVNRLPKYTASVMAFYDGLKAWLRDFEFVGYQIQFDVVQDWFVTRLPALGKVFADQTTNALKGVSSGIAALLNLLMIPFVTFYILKDYKKIGAFLQRLMPPRHLNDVQALFDQIDGVLGQYIRGQMLVCSFIALLTSFGLGVLGIRYAVLLGIMAGIFNLVPFIGLAVSLMVASLVAVLDTEPLIGLLKVVGVFVVVQSIEGNFLSPKVVGERVGLHPGWVMFALVVFAHFWGFVGLLVAIPVAAVVNILVRILSDRYFQSQYYTHSAQDIAG